MQYKHVIFKVFLIGALCFFASFGWAGEPTEKIKQTTEKILSVVTDKSLKDPAKAGERKKNIRKAVDERFDWQEMARRSLARHWLQRTEEERQAFTALFSDLLERTYLNKVEGYSGEKVHYSDESIDDDYSDDYSVVKVKIITSKNDEIEVDYRLRRKNGDWFVYDISIEGVSLVNNYRVQFNNILMRSSYKKLVQRLQEKVSEQ